MTELMRLNRSQTKTIVTLGPASWPKEILRQIFYEGVDVCRLNFSHGKHDDHLKAIYTIRELNRELEAHVAIMADLQGPKIRIGDVKNGQVLLKEDDIIEMSTKLCDGTNKLLYINYQNFPLDVKQGEKILMDDGKIRLEVLETNLKDTVKLKVINGGYISSHKGVNLPDTKTSLPCLTEKDQIDLHFALKNDVDWIALSFVRRVDDIKELRNLINIAGKNTSIIAKIEKPEALEDIDAIIEETDAVMVARGDLGVEASFEKVPLIQKELIQKCINKGKPVIVATQMLESMITNFEPTRAEVTDVANAVLDGADALMLSGETSVGKYPVEALRNMQKIIDYTEANGFKFNREAEHTDSKRIISDSICDAARRLSDIAHAKAIVTFTTSGYSAYKMSSYRPKASIFVFTQSKELICRMSLVWGVRAFNVEMVENIDKSIKKTLDYLKKKRFINTGDIVIHLASIPLSERGKTNALKVSIVI